MMDRYAQLLTIRRSSPKGYRVYIGNKKKCISKQALRLNALLNTQYSIYLDLHYINLRLYMHKHPLAIK